VDGTSAGTKKIFRAQVKGVTCEDEDCKCRYQSLKQIATLRPNNANVPAQLQMSSRYQIGMLRLGRGLDKEVTGRRKTNSLEVLEVFQILILQFVNWTIPFSAPRPLQVGTLTTLQDFENTGKT
jgi:hypothetical protein